MSVWKHGIKYVDWLFMQIIQLGNNVFYIWNYQYFMGKQNFSNFDKIIENFPNTVCLKKNAKKNYSDHIPENRL